MKKFNPRALGLIATITASMIYGMNHTIAKGVMPNYLTSYAFIMTRLIGAASLFWIASLFIPKERIRREDWKIIVLGSLLGTAINMQFIFKGLELSTPINSSILVTISPIIVLILSVLFLKERVKAIKVVGISLGLVGAIGMIIFGSELRQDAPNIPLGNFFFVISAIAYGSYLVVAKKLMETYHPITIMKWLFLIAIIINAPLSTQDFLTTKWASIPLSVYASIAYVVIGTTFMTYLLNGFAMTRLKVSTIGALMYLQPVIGVLFAIVLGKDELSLIKITGAILVFTGVYFASKK